MNSSFFDNKHFGNIDPEKLALLFEITKNNSPKNSSEVVPFLLNASKKANEKGIKFTPEETDIIIEVLKQSLSEAEQKKVDLIRNLMKKK